MVKTANKANYVQGHLPVARSGPGGDIVTPDASRLYTFKREGKLEVVVEVDETPVFILTGGIFKTRRIQRRCFI